jgi:alpha-tubulin suppressor-like RCC1 family protein
MTNARPSPYVLAMPARVVSATGGRWNSCAALETGEARCWGEGDSGQLGDGNSTTSGTPVSVIGLNDVVEVAVGAVHACARRAPGEVYCWGAGGSGRLGTGNTTSSSTPVQTVGISTAKRLVAGGSASCAILADDALLCWGYNQDGGVGVNTTTDVLMPVAPIGLTTVRSVSTRDVTSCAVRGDGAVMCFGGNASGQAGIGSVGGIVRVPTQVVKQDSSPLLGADEVGQGINHGCARLGTEVWCWGADDVGQLGDGAIDGTPRGYAARVLGLPPTYQLAIGAFTSCAVDAGAVVWCWGGGSAGELGDGTTTAARPVPQPAFDACP